MVCARRVIETQRRRERVQAKGRGVKGGREGREGVDKNDKKEKRNTIEIKR
jgi:hypothetical protein